MNLRNKLIMGNLIAAHRGHRAYYPENTMAAFRDCVSDCDFIELDVRFSKDGVPVVFHDHTLERTSDIHKCGLFPGREDHRLETFNFNELRQLDAGSWFYKSDPHNQIAEGNVIIPSKSERRQNIPSLDEVLEFISASQLAVNVELKCLHEDREASAKWVINSLKDSNLVDNTVVSAFDHSILELIKQLDSSIATAALVEDKHPENLSTYLVDLKADGYHIHDDMASQSLFDELRHQGIFVCVYTVNDRKRKKQLLDMGASAVITDFLHRE